MLKKRYQLIAEKLQAYYSRCRTASTAAEADQIIYAQEWMSKHKLVLDNLIGGIPLTDLDIVLDDNLPETVNVINLTFMQAAYDQYGGFEGHFDIEVAITADLVNGYNLDFQMDIVHIDGYSLGELFLDYWHETLSSYLDMDIMPEDKVLVA